MVNTTKNVSPPIRFFAAQNVRCMYRYMLIFNFYQLIRWWHHQLIRWWHHQLIRWWHHKLIRWWHHQLIRWWHHQLIRWWHHKFTLHAHYENSARRIHTVNPRSVERTPATQRVSNEHLQLNVFYSETTEFSKNPCDVSNQPVKVSVCTHGECCHSVETTLQKC